MKMVIQMVTVMVIHALKSKVFKNISIYSTDFQIIIIIIDAYYYIL
jgi:hypothetical protein